MVETLEPPRTHVPLRRRLIFLLPLVLFLALVAVLGPRLTIGEGVSRVPSPLIDKPVPEFSLPGVEGIQGSAAGFSDQDVSKGVHLVNVWASWCGPCREEHPILMMLSKDPSFTLLGINKSDNDVNAARFLGALGNPFDAVGADRKGRVSIDWGVYGIPETFIVKDGVIRYKHIGPIGPDILRKSFMPALQQVLEEDRVGPVTSRAD